MGRKLDLEVLKLEILSTPHRRKAQPVRADVRADHRRHVDQQDIARQGLVHFHHHPVQELARPLLRAGMQDRQPFAASRPVA